MTEPRRRIVEFGSMPQKDNAFTLAFRKLVAQHTEAVRLRDPALAPQHTERHHDELATAVLERLKRRR